jgi:hypothetical protein
MTEVEWLTSDDPGRMLDYVRPDEIARKPRLFKCACCYILWPLLIDPRSREGVSVAERYADGLATADEVERAVSGAKQAASDIPRRSWGRKVTPALHRARKAAAERACEVAGFWAAGLARWILNPTDHPTECHGMVPPAPAQLPVPGGGEDALYRWLAHLVRDVFGNPFRPVAVDPRWRTETVLALAQGAYADRAFDRLPILADALQDAGCDNADVLDHCRGPGPHVRGCWVVDLILGKE